MGMEMSGNAVMTGGMTPSEAILVTDRDRYRNDGWFGDGNGMWVLFLFFLMAWGGNGFGGFGGFGTNGALTRAELQQGFDFNNLERQVQGIQQGLCDGFYAQNTTMLQGFSGIGREILQNRFDSEKCCCETNRNIDAVRYENAKNTCDITSAIHAEGEATRALINANTMQDLRDHLEARDRELMTANFQLSQQAQSANLIDALRPCPVPAYPSCSPYAVGSWSGYGYGCGYGCGCN